MSNTSPSVSTEACISCDKQIQAQSNFCPYCGFALDSLKERSKSRQSNSRWSAVRGVLFLYLFIFFTIIPLHMIYDVEVAKIYMIVVGWLDLLVISIVYLKMRKTLPVYKKYNLQPVVWFVCLFVLVASLLLNFGYHDVLTRYFNLRSTSLTDMYFANGFTMHMMVFMICVLPAVSEELAFRTVIQERLKQILPTNEAMIITAALFSILHLNFLGAPYLFLLGWIMCYIKEYTNRLLPCIIFHFFHNFAVLMFDYF